MPGNKDKDSHFQTHIEEPKHQQILSVIIVLVIGLLWLGLAIFSK
jgi:hypothetical protein